MFYSIVPYDQLFSTNEEEYKYEEVAHNGLTIQVYRKDDKMIIKRVISTDPKVYLDEKYSPGSELKM
ncbi:YlzJ-like family protein [Vallitalea pronyensis]|uniref:YlzJ-like family protein n=1 Tax=Vallitalea pronyensis TaxID=1348613 RepID=A0A8J8MJX1_9FIRM|nr:YlzJ-like family protein [Vallitalea pronyensis]QUI23034.1 YlzJ-like family protein [Vallitalea pronyensis]